MWGDYSALVYPDLRICSTFLIKPFHCCLYLFLKVEGVWEKIWFFVWQWIRLRFQVLSMHLPLIWSRYVNLIIQHTISGLVSYRKRSHIKEKETSHSVSWFTEYKSTVYVISRTQYSLQRFLVGEQGLEK